MKVKWVFRRRVIIIMLRESEPVPGITIITMEITVTIIITIMDITLIPMLIIL